MSRMRLIASWTRSRSRVGRACPAAPRHCNRGAAGRGWSSARCSHRDICRAPAAGPARRCRARARAPRDAGVPRGETGRRVGVERAARAGRARNRVDRAAASAPRAPGSASRASPRSRGPSRDEKPCRCRPRRGLDREGDGLALGRVEVALRLRTGGRAPTDAARLMARVVARLRPRHCAARGRRGPCRPAPGSAAATRRRPPVAHDQPGLGRADLVAVVGDRHQPQLAVEVGDVEAIPARPVGVELDQAGEQRHACVSATTSRPRDVAGVAAGADACRARRRARRSAGRSRRACSTPSRRLPK